MATRVEEMATRTQSDTSLGVAYSEELDALQSILAAQGKAVSYEEVIDISHELLDFFEALGEENEQSAEDSHA